MAKTSIDIPRTKTPQPSVGTTRKAQKRYQQPIEYDARTINSELDFVHERINAIIVEDPSISDLESTATLSDVITRVNLLTEIIRKAALLRRE